MPPPTMATSTGSTETPHHGGHRGHEGTAELEERFLPPCPPYPQWWRTVAGLHSRARTRSSSIAMNVGDVFSDSVRLSVVENSRATCAAWTSMSNRISV